MRPGKGIAGALASLRERHRFREKQVKPRAGLAHPHCREARERKMGAGIAADPLSPDFDPLGISEETPAPSGFGGMLHPCRERHQASHFGHRGRARYPFGPQRRDLRRPARSSGRNPIIALWPLSPNHLPPVARRRASSLHGHALPHREDRKGRLDHLSGPVRQAFACATAGIPARSNTPPTS